MTAIEWLEEQMFNLQIKLKKERMPLTKYESIRLELLEQAKEMEKKIIAQAFEDGDYNYFYNHQNGREFLNGIEYYNEKFKSE